MRLCVPWILFAILATQSLSAPPVDTHSDRPASYLRRQPGRSTTPHAWLEINAANFKENLRTMKKEVGAKTKVCPVMKADGYGHGIEMLMPSILEENITCLGITSNEEARAARRAGFKGQLMRLRTATLEEMEDGIRFEIEEILGDVNSAKALSDLAKKMGKTLRYHLAVNAGGMGRGSLELGTEQGKADALKLLKLPNLKLVAMMTHFPVEEKEDVKRVLELFKSQTAWLIKAGNLDRNEITLHAANSYATLEVPEARLDLVRPGGALYGDTVPSHTEYKRVMAFKSSVATINEFPAGATVSYDRTFTLTRPSRIANIPVGYSDGYRRSLSNQAYVLIRGRRYPVVGRVTMNMTMVDITDAPDISPSDEVVLFGRQGNGEITQSELEKSTGTIFADLYTIWGLANPRVLGE